eukprot:Mrub_09178.p1 GENE.Mrub_09178~~Mrub_09178.p1  ORF type:complete len:241 (+),score=2.51 Mrub_09178:28-723(+)
MNVYNTFQLLIKYSKITQSVRTYIATSAISTPSRISCEVCRPVVLNRSRAARPIPRNCHPVVPRIIRLQHGIGQGTEYKSEFNAYYAYQRGTIIYNNYYKMNDYNTSQLNEFLNINYCPKYEDFNRLRPCHNEASYQRLCQVFKDNCKHEVILSLTLKYLVMMHNMYKQNKTIKTVDYIETAKSHEYTTAFFIYHEFIPLREKIPGANNHKDYNERSKIIYFNLHRYPTCK